LESDFFYKCNIRAPFKACDFSKDNFIKLKTIIAFEVRFSFKIVKKVYIYNNII